MEPSIKGRVLLVDDEAQVRNIMGAVLRKNDFYVETAANWSEAHTKLSRHEFDVLLIDLHLPGIDGDRYATVIRQTAMGKSLKIVIFSNEEKEILAERAIQAGADGYITKSEPSRNFVRKLESYLPGYAPRSSGVVSKSWTCRPPDYNKK